MANVSAIHSVGDSITTYLRNSYPEPLRTDHPCVFSLISSGEFVEPDAQSTSLSLFLYRITMDEHLRNGPRRNGTSGQVLPLALDLHYLLTVWADSALVEHTVIAWAMRQLYLHPVLDRSSLTPEGGWDTGDTIQLIPAEISAEDIMRIWDALSPPYRLSVSYIARVVRIDPDTTPDARPVVATRFAWTDRKADE